MKKILIYSFLLLFAALIPAGAQNFLTLDDLPVNGYSSKISGLDFDYHSCIPGLRESILIRANTGKDQLEWETDPVPSAGGKKYSAFIWIAAIGSSPGRAGMDLVTDSQQQFTFYTDGKPDWTIRSEDGSSLTFHSIMIDQHGDHHGYMILRIPSSDLKAGQTLKIRVSGKKNNLTSWYMTFRKPVRTGVTLNTYPAIIKEVNKTLQYVEAAIFYFGEETRAQIYADNKLIASTNLKFGYNSVSTGLPEVSKPVKVRLRVETGDLNITGEVTLFPVRKWNVSFIQHTHTDIGYTRSQTEILAEHLRYIDYALDYCDATDNYPDNAKFRWTCEASWPVDEYLKSRPESQIKRLIERIREGRIEVTGMYFNFDEIPDEQILAASLEAAGRIRNKGIPLTLAMQNDVNGIGWCLNDYFNTLGIRYLNMGTHGHRALICFDKPTMFWWESPSGKRILTFRAEHYMTGNTLFEIQARNIDKFRYNLLNYLQNLDSKKYPYNEIAIQHSGFLTDNSPPSTSLCELIKEWNEIFEWPKISTSLTGTFFSKMETEHSDEFPVIRGAWPDWWTDGFGAAARETAAVRKASASLIANMGGLSMASLSGLTIPDVTRDKTELANNALLFYTEHTTGYSESVREPLSLQTMEQRALKESYAWEATRRTAAVGEDAMGLLQSRFQREKDPSFIVFNTLNWSRPGTATVYIDHQLVPRGKMAGIFDREGTRLPAQALSHRSDGTYWMVWLNDIPAFGYKKFTLKALNETEPGQSNDPPPVLENKWYKIVADPSKGTISSWFDKELKADFADKNAVYGLGEFILEELGNRSQMESRKLDDYTRKGLDTIWFESMRNGAVFNSLLFCGESKTAEGPKGFSFEVRLFNNEKRIELVCSIIKKNITDPESIYIAFPIKLDEGRHFTEVQGGIIETGKDQIPGSSNDWYTVQTFTTVRSSNSQIVLSCTEMPLMQFGAINTGRYTAGARPQGTHLYSWPMNNYWVTNFNADQRGGHTWTYCLTSSSDVSDSFATRFGWGSRIPFLTRILPGEGKGDNNWEGDFINGWPSGILLVSSKPGIEDNSLLLHIREIEGRSVSFNLTGGLTGEKLILTECDVTGTPLEDPEISIGPLESKFFLIKSNL